MLTWPTEAFLRVEDGREVLGEVQGGFKGVVKAGSRGASGDDKAIVSRRRRVSGSISSLASAVVVGLSDRRR